MLVHDRFLFLQLQKCASTMLAQVIEREVGGVHRSQGQHSRVRSPVQGRRVIGSVRDPWSWYVSLWAFGCDGLGAFRYRATDENYRSFGRGVAYDAIRFQSLTAGLRILQADRRRDSAFWRDVYSDSSDPELFRTWLNAILEKRNATVGEPGFGISRVAGSVGLLTWRYCWLYWAKVRPLITCRSDDIPALDRELGIVDDFIRVDRLALDLPMSLRRAGVKVDEALKARLEDAVSTPQNASRHGSPVDYYDDQTLELVASLDRFVIQKHGFDSPIHDQATGRG